jgi:hypothetical protein
MYFSVFVYIPIPTRAGSFLVQRISILVVLSEVWAEHLEAECNPPHCLWLLRRRQERDPQNATISC